MQVSKHILCLLIVYVSIISCNGQPSSTQPKKVGGPFENPEFTYYGIPKVFSSSDTSAAWYLAGEKLLLTGTVFGSDGKTPSPDVLIYYYQTNSEGRYIHKPDVSKSMPPNELGQTHGFIRGWVKTDKDGKYYIYTTRPGVYPTRDEPAHIHVTIKEPNDINEYYIDDFVFDDDEILNTARRRKMENRGGSGVLRLVKQNDMFIGERNIFLGLNIPDYKSHSTEIHSGRNIGEDVLSFIPYHAWGPDKGTRTCPVCKYGWYHGILYLVGNKPDWNDIKSWLKFLESESRKREKHLKVYFVYGNQKNYNKEAREKELEKIGNELQLKHVALTIVPSFSDSNSDIDLLKVNPEVENTFIIYKRSKIVDKFINFKSTESNFTTLQKSLDNSINEYFDLPDILKKD